MTLNAILMQIVNGYVAVTSFIGALVFLRYLYKNRHLGYPSLRPAIAIFAVFVGGTILWAYTFQYRILLNDGVKVQYPVVGVLIASSIIEIAFLCMIRVFSPDHWGYKTWLGTLILSTIVVALSFVYVTWT